MFGKESKDEKVAREKQEFVKKFNLDELSENDFNVVKRIANGLFSKNFYKTGMALNFSRIEEQAKVTYLDALVEQNWLIINQLSRICKLLEKSN